MSVGRLRVAWIAVVVAGLAVAAYFAVGSRNTVHHEHPERPLAPEFSLVDLDGKHITLSSLRGKVVIVDFWATWCGPCRDEAPGLVSLQKRWGRRGLQLVGISMDDKDAPVRKFVREYRVNYPIALGDAELGRRYGTVLGLPVKIVVDRFGRIASRHNGTVSADTLEREIQSILAE